MKLSRIAILLLIAAMPVQLLAAWTQNEGHGQVINSFSFYTADSFYDVDGERFSTPRYSKLEYSPYAEYGVTNDITVGLSPRIASAVADRVGGGDDKAVAVQSVDFFVRKKFYDNNGTVVSIQPLIKLPGVYDRDDEFLLGERQVDAELRLLAGHGFKSFGRDHFIEGEVGYRKRMESPEDEIKLDATVGIRPCDKWLILGQGFTTLTTDQASSSSFLFNNSSSYNLLQLQLSGVYDLDEKISLQAGGFKNVWAENTGGGGGLLFSVWYRF